MRFAQSMSFRGKELASLARATAVAFFVASAGCSQSGGGVTDEPATTPPPPINAPPVVDAGLDATTRLPEDTVALDATVTDDGLPSNTMITTWSVSSGPGGATFSDVNVEDTSVTFVNAGTYVLQLTASDSELEATDTVEITVEAAFVTIDTSPPTADTGGPYTGMQGAAIGLDGSGSTDPDGDIAAYDWDLDNDGVYDDATGVTPTFAAAGAGVFTIGLRVSDLEGASDTSTTTVTVANLVPFAVSQALSLPEDTVLPIVLAGWDPGGDPLAFVVVKQPANGVLSGVVPGVTYTPNPDFNGSDSFNFMVNDGQLDSPIATVSIAVSAVNDPPVAFDQSSTAVSGEAITLQLEYDDVDGPGPFTLHVTKAPKSGSLTPVNPDGSILYTPDTGFTGNDAFKWRVNDGVDDSTEATVTVAVEPAPPAGIYFPPAGESLASQSLRSPDEVGLSDSVVADLSAVITTGRWALWRHGYLVHVEGDFNTTDEVKSVRKIIHAATVGAAIQRGLVPSLDQPIAFWNPELSGTDAMATWVHVMTQTTAFDEPLLDPGSLWAYSDANPLQLSRALARVWGRPGYTDRYDLVIADALFDAIGARGWSAVPAADGIRFLFDLEDLGRAGLLFIAGGEWNGHRLIPPWFMDELGTKQTYGIPPNYDNENDGHTGLRVEDFPESPYGFMTWVNTDRDLYPDSSTNWVVALGVGGHYLVYNRDFGLILAVIDGDFVPIDGNPAGWPTPVRIAIEVLEQAMVGPNPMVEGTLPSQ